LLAKKESQNYQEITRERKTIERIFAESKKYHGLGKARWKDKWKMWIQSLLTFLVINCKRLVSWLLAPPQQAFLPILFKKAKYYQNHLKVS